MLHINVMLCFQTGQPPDSPQSEWSEDTEKMQPWLSIVHIIIIKADS